MKSNSKIKIADKQESKDGSTKYLFSFSDGALAEAVSFSYNNENAICISTQIGCGVLCKFCAVSELEFKRNLEVGEMLAQVELALDAEPTLDSFDEVAFQGTGEPLSNLKNVSEAASQLVEKGLCTYLSLATSGNLQMFPRIKDTPVKKVYLSLHASNDKKRTAIIPTNKSTGVEKLIKLAKDHAISTDTKITINYLLLKDFNDTKNDLKTLLKLLSPDYFQVQLMHLNKVITKAGKKLKPSTHFKVFEEELLKHGFDVTILHSKGIDVAGGCGQMISKFQTTQI